MAGIIRINPSNLDPRALEEAGKIIRKGGIVAYPTETFYGLGADGGSESSVEKIFAVKGRDFNKPIPLIIAGRSHLAAWAASIPETAQQLMDRFWPGPLTLLFQALPGVSSRLTGGTGKIGIRCSSNTIAAGLAALIGGGALTATSANLSGQEECVSAGEVMDRLGSRIDAVIDGGTTPGEKGSTIVDVTADPPVIIREGVIPASLILDMLGKI
ncbi:MAG: threonylcarbamoyl-AMP synthase [Deltaproteobacteria bacterium]|nr:threonylcarbamoyl-AMP synthase [Deltaproteobacteria bacterium]MBN2688821.1 threonylcarbamoyl-AMP synthase [Deltaproteobacteria bacterium]